MVCMYFRKFEEGAYLIAFVGQEILKCQFSSQCTKNLKKSVWNLKQKLIKITSTKVENRKI